MGLPTPTFIKNILAIVKDKTGEGTINEYEYNNNMQRFGTIITGSTIGMSTLISRMLQGRHS